jgi:hypothetical protein
MHMPFSFKLCDCKTLVVDKEFDILNEELLAQYVGRIVLGHYVHVKKIINDLSSTSPLLSQTGIDLAINKMKSEGKSQIELDKRDGWIFQIISWLVLYVENKGTRFYCQPPHDASAQHGLDGLAIVLDMDNKIQSLIITEDKCTENHRVVIPTQVWPEFERFETGVNNNKIVSRVSAMIEAIGDGSLLEANQNNLLDRNLWVYRLGINRDKKYESMAGRKKLFKGYDVFVKEDDPHRRFAATILRDEVREWMKELSLKVVRHLTSLKPTHV